MILRTLETPGPWLWLAIAAGAILRAWLVFFTAGTDDVPIWASHAGWTVEYGLVGYYEWQEVFNHPPFIGKVMSWLWLFGKAYDIPFRFLLRVPFVLLDLGNALLLLRLFRDVPYRYAIAAGYWLHPLAILYSGYHGNTDTGVAFFCLLALYFATQKRALAAGAALGVGLWVKLPVSLAAPVLLLAFPSWRERGRFAAAALLVGVSTYLPVLVDAAGLVYARVIAYPGLNITTPGGTPIWSIWSVFGIVESLPPGLRGAFESAAAAHAANNTLACLLPLGVYAWLRRHETGVRDLGTSLCGSFVIFYAMNNNFLSFQYLAWSIPFWFFPRPLFGVLATLTIGGYVYGAYVLFCDDFLLRGVWDFRAHPLWPGWLMLWRDVAVLFAFVSAWVFLGSAVRAEWRRRGEARC
jgi:hypothetical protein